MNIPVDSAITRQVSYPTIDEPLTGRRFIEKPPVAHFSGLPEEIQMLTFSSFLSSATPGQVCKKWANLQSAGLDEAWSKVEADKINNPVIAEYLNEIGSHLSPKEKFAALYEKMLGDAQSLNEDLPGSFGVRKVQLPPNPSERVFDPTLYEELAGLIKNTSLERVWQRLSQLTFPIQAPGLDASALEIRLFLNHPSVQTILQSVIDLNLGDLNLVRIPEELNQFTRLEKISFKSSNIRRVDENLFAHFPNLTTVVFDKNKIRHLPQNFFGANPQLIRASFTDNEIEQIPEHLFANNRNLMIASFNGNGIRQVPQALFFNSSRVRYLDFSKNQIEAISPHLLTNCPELESVDFSKNQLRDLPKTLLHNNRQIQRAHFNSNFIQWIPQDLFAHAPALKSVAFSGNNLIDVPNTLFLRCPNLNRAQFYDNPRLTLPQDLYNHCPKMTTYLRRFARRIQEPLKPFIHPRTVRAALRETIQMGLYLPICALGLAPFAGVGLLVERRDNIDANPALLGAALATTAVSAFGLYTFGKLSGELRAYVDPLLS